MLQVALVGTGNFAGAHAAVLHQLPGVRIKYIVGSDPRRTAAFSARVPGTVPSTDLEAVLADPELDAVDVVNRTADHAPVSIAAARAGKHVHVDKPAALTVADFDAMVAAAEGAGVTLMVGQTVRFQPIIARMHAAVTRGDIGDPRLLHITWYTGHVWPGGWRAWQYDVTQSGGHPVHNGIHILDTATWLLGSAPTEVMTRGFNSWAPGMTVPDSFSMVTRFADGSLATLELCYALRQRGDLLRRVVLAGEQGTLKHSTADDPGLGLVGKTMPASVDDALVDQLRHWTGVVRGAEAPIVVNSQVRAALAAGIAAQQSLVSKEPVRIEQEVRS